MKESKIEAALVRGVRELGGRAYKFVSPGCTGVPDRIVILPGGRVEFIELKTKDGRMSMIQNLRQEEMRSLGASVRTLYDMVDVVFYLSQLREEVRPE